MNMLTRSLPWVGLLLITTGLIACTKPQVQPQPAPLPEDALSDGAIDAAETAPSEDPAQDLSWSAILGPTSAPAGWQVTPCDNPILLCVYEGDDLLGTVELFTETVAGSTFETMLAEANGDRIQALTTWSEQHYATLEQDRKMGDSTVTFSSVPPEEVAVGGLPGLRYGFTTAHANGALIDRTFGYVTTDGETLYVFVTGVISGDPGGTFSDNAVAQQFEPYLADIIAGLNL